MFKWIKSLFKKQLPEKVIMNKNIIPFAVQSPKRMKTHGKYEKGYPLGAVVHFTAGRYDGGVKKALDTIEGGIKNGFTFLCIGNDGSLVQAHPVDEWGYHAGESAWKNPKFLKRLVGTVSDDLIGIEINCAGKLEKTKDGRYMTWFKTYIDEKDVRYVTEAEYGCPTGYYHKYTPEQEATLIKTLVWLKENDPTGQFSFDLVLGHDEVAGKLGIGYFRKNDPGGSISMPMSKLREHLKSIAK
jgi:N-acetyl-anhydromuramyl-L-alanine amidase AmpD